MKTSRTENTLTRMKSKLKTSMVKSKNSMMKLKFWRNETTKVSRI